MENKSKTSRPRPRPRRSPKPEVMTLGTLSKTIVSVVDDRLNEYDKRRTAAALAIDETLAERVPRLAMPPRSTAPAPPPAVAGLLREAVGEIDNALCEHQKVLDELTAALAPVSQPAPPADTGDLGGLATVHPVSDATARCRSLAQSIRRNTRLVQDLLSRLEV